jgi:hypothetical protein
VFFPNYLLSFETQIDHKENQILLFSDKIEEYFVEDKKSEEINFLFEYYPILLPNVLEIEAKGQTVLSFTEEQIILIKQFKYIEVIPGKVDNFVEKN